VDMKWPTVEDFTASVPLPDGYTYALPTRVDIPRLLKAVDAWFPGLAVGNASCYLREDFYHHRVFFEELHERDFFVLLFKAGEDWAGMLSVERDKDSQVLYGRVGTIAAAHRGARLSKRSPPLMETMGKNMGMGMVYSLATLKVPHMQVGFEKAGWQLIGVIPGFDRELVGPGEVKRVYEAIYVKVLVTDSEFLLPTAEGLTPATRGLFRHLYPGLLSGAPDDPSVESPPEAQRERGRQIAFDCCKAALSPFTIHSRACMSLRGHRCNVRFWPISAGEAKVL